MKPEKLKERAITLAGDAAGAVADPKAGLTKVRSKAKSKAKSPALLVIAGAIAVAFLIGRRRALRHT
jgi:hypothetical protein